MANAFTEFLHDTKLTDIPPQMQALGRQWLLDLLGVAAAGTQTELSRVIHRHATAHFGPGAKSATVLFDGRAASAPGVALAGGCTIDAVDAHDGHKLTKGHTGCGVLPALAALSEAEGMEDDQEFLAAFIVGYELATRAGIALHRTASDYHTSGAWVALGVAGLGARAMGLTADQTRHAIGIAEYHGPRSQMMRVIDHPAMLKDGSGWGAMSGVSAAYLAADGFTGAPAITVEGADVQDLWQSLGQRWCIAEQYFKHFPVCRWAQPPVQAVLDVRRAHGLRSEVVDHIAIETFHHSKRLATRDPKTTEEAQYSTAFPAAVALVRGRVDPADVADAALNDPEIARIAQGMRIDEDAGFTAAFPERRIARVTIVLKDGQRLTSADTEAPGDPENPVSNADVRAKFHAYAEPVLGKNRASVVEAAVDGLGKGSGLGALRAAILPAP